MGTRKRYAGALIGALVGAVVLTGCSGDEVVTETAGRTVVEEGLRAWRTATAAQAGADQAAAINRGLEQWREAAAARARLAAEVRVELLLAQARVAGDALRGETDTRFGIDEAEIERLRAAARVAGDTLRMKTVDGAE